MSCEVKTYLDEKKADTLKEAAVLADDYVLTHKGVFNQRTPTVTHLDQRASPFVPSNHGQRQNNVRGSGKNQQLNARDRRRNSPFPAGPECYYCKKKGHVMADCWHLKNANSGTLRPTMMTVRDQSSLSRIKLGISSNPVELNRAMDEYTPFISKLFIHALGSKDWIPITILRNTGANQSLLLESSLPQSAVTSTGTSTLIQGVELETVSVPLHKVILNCNIVCGPVILRVRHSLPVTRIDLILGNNLTGEKVTSVPYMLNSPEEIQDNTDEVMVYPACAITRAMTKQAQVDQSESQSLREKAVNEIDGGDQLDLADTFIAHDRELTAERHELGQDGLAQGENNQTQDMENPGVGAIGKEGLIELQEWETTLSHIREQVVSEPEAAPTQVGYYKKSGVLMSRWRPLDDEGSETWRAVHQIVVPRQYQNEVLRLAHENPLAGHLGINKTYRKVFEHFYWPGLRKDAVKFCTTCHTCQMIGKPNQCNQVAPLIPIPAMEEPSSRVIVDCVGPLPKAKSGNKYLLTIMCSSTRFPEAIPLTLYDPNY